MSYSFIFMVFYREFQFRKKVCVYLNNISKTRLYCLSIPWKKIDMVPICCEKLLYLSIKMLISKARKKKETIPNRTFKKNKPCPNYTRFCFFWKQLMIQFESCTLSLDWSSPNISKLQNYSFRHHGEKKSSKQTRKKNVDQFISKINVR